MRYDVQTEESELFSESRKPEQHNVSWYTRTITKEVITEHPNSVQVKPPHRVHMSSSDLQVVRRYNGASRWGSNSFQPNVCPNQQEELTEKSK